MSDDNKSTSASATGGNLDITQVDNEDFEKLAQTIEQFYKVESTVKTRLAYHWDRNHKFLDGEQWLVFDGDRETGGVWKRLTVSKPNEYIPRPVTNYIFDAYQTLKSYLVKERPRSTVRPNTQTFRDKAAAKVAELCIEANWEKLHEADNYEYAASCLLTYGTVFKKDYWDPSAAGMVSVPQYTQQPQTDPNTGQPTGEMQDVPALDEFGQPIMQDLPLGDYNTEIVEPYRIALDPAAVTISQIKWIMEYSIQTLDWIVDTYQKDPENAPGYTGLAQEVKEERDLSTVMRRFYNLKTSSGVKGTAGIAEGSVSHAGESNITNSAVVKEYYERPTMKHPNGRMIVVAGGKVLYSGDSPYKGNDLGDWHPYSEARWEIVPGRFWGKSPLDVACDIQKQINSIDSVIILTRKTSAIPQKLIPLNSGVANGMWTGRPGQEIFYRDSGGSKPELLPAQGVDPTVFQERAQRVEDLKNVTGAIDILKGDHPPGITAASALNMLFEVGSGKLFPALERWKTFVENSQKKQLKIIANKYQEPREDYIRILMSMNSELSEQAINKFIGADLYDNTNVIVEAGSNIPKLQAAKQAQLQESAQTGTLSLENPKNRMEFNRQMGLVGFDDDVEPDTKRAEWENDILDNIGNPGSEMPVVLNVDEDAIHMDVLARRMKEPSYMSLSPQVQNAYLQHYEQHSDAKAKKEQMQQMQAMATGMMVSQATGQSSPPGGEQSQGSSAPTPIKSAGKGINKTQANALRGDIFTPGTKP